MDCFASLAMTVLTIGRPCEERSDEATHVLERDWPMDCIGFASQ